MKTIYSLLCQSHRIEKVVISIPIKYKRFEEKVNVNDILKIHEKVEVQELDTDYGCATKFYGALKYFHSLSKEEQKDLSIIICDDDLIYDLELVKSYNEKLTNEKIIYTFFRVEHYIQTDFKKIPHLQGADTYLIPNHFLKNYTEVDFKYFLEKILDECEDAFYNDDYTISFFVNVLCNYDIRNIASRYIKGMVYKESEQILELHRDSRVNVRTKNTINYLKKLLDTNYIN